MALFENNNCGQTLIDTGLEPLVEAYHDAVIAAKGNYYAPLPWVAMNNIYKACRIVPYAFYTDINGEWQDNDLIGMRLVTMNAVTNPLDIIVGEITLDPVTGIITSPYAEQQHIGSIGWHIDGFGDNTP